MMDTTPPPAFAPALDEVYGAGLLPPDSEDGVAAPPCEWLGVAEEPRTTLSAVGDDDLGAVVVAAGETGVCAGDAEVVNGVGVLGAVGVAAEDAGWRATGGLESSSANIGWCVGSMEDVLPEAIQAQQTSRPFRIERFELWRDGELRCVFWKFLISQATRAKVVSGLSG